MRTNKIFLITIVSIFSLFAAGNQMQNGSGYGSGSDKGKMDSLPMSRGTIQSVDSTDSSFTLQTMNGTSETFKFTDTTKFMGGKKKALKEGEKVTVHYNTGADDQKIAVHVMKDKGVRDGSKMQKNDTSMNGGMNGGMQTDTQTNGGMQSDTQTNGGMQSDTQTNGGMRSDTGARPPMQDTGTGTMPPDTMGF